MITARVKMVFFDRSVIKRNWSKINENPMKKSGLLVRRIALNKIGRSVSYAVKTRTPPGPPRSRLLSTQLKRLRTNPKLRVRRPFKMIYSIPKNFNTGVIVGMIGFDANRPVPGFHEHGMRASQNQPIIGQQFKQWKKRQLKKYPGRNPKTINLGPRPRVKVTANYPRRPFMQPSLSAAAPRIPSFWRNALTRVSVP